MLTRRSRRAGGVSPLSVCVRRPPTWGERGASAPCLCAVGGRRPGASGGRQPPVCVQSTVADMRRAGGRHPPVYVQSAAADMRRAGGVSPLSVGDGRSPTCGERGASAPCLCAIDGRRRAASGRREPRCLCASSADELADMPFERRGAHLFFQLVNRRYEKGSLLVTTNQRVSEWGTVFGDEVLATAILDRLLHHSHTLMITGESYRLREKRKSGLIRSKLANSTPEASLQEQGPKPEKEPGKGVKNR